MRKFLAILLALVVICSGGILTGCVAQAPKVEELKELEVTLEPV